MLVSIKAFAIASAQLKCALAFTFVGSLIVLSANFETSQSLNLEVFPKNFVFVFLFAHFF